MCGWERPAGHDTGAGQRAQRAERVAGSARAAPRAKGRPQKQAAAGAPRAPDQSSVHAPADMCERRSLGLEPNAHERAPRPRALRARRQRAPYETAPHDALHTANVLRTTASVGVKSGHKFWSCPSSRRGVGAGTGLTYLAAK